MSETNTSNAGISAEAQHVLNSLEAHFAAVVAATKGADKATIDHVKSAFEAVLKRLDAWGVRLARDVTEVHVDVGTAGQAAMPAKPAPAKPVLAGGVDPLPAGNASVATATN